MYISTLSLFVNDTDRAVVFFTEKLGWELRQNEQMGENMRWVTVAPPNERTAFVLVKGFANWSQEKVGGWAGVVIEVDDVFAAHKEWSARGVEFTEVPSVQFYGGWAQFKDSEGNELGLHSQAPANK
ncbi:MAG TPA: VOC family protein [Candidatus Baltobacteraceae bacterium]